MAGDLSTSFEPLREYRDDTPGISAVSRPLGRFGPGPLLSTLLGLLPIPVLLLLDRDLNEVTIGVAWALIVVSAASHKPLTGPLAWLVVPMIRAGEYAVIIVVGWRADLGAGAALFAWLAPLVLHHYDIVYRILHQHRPPPSWLRGLLLGWQGRMVLAVVAANADATILVGYVYGGVLGAVVLAEIIIGWRTFFALEREMGTA